MIEYRNLYWDAPDHSRMQAEIKHPDFGWIPYCCMEGDTGIGAELWAARAYLDIEEWRDRRDLEQTRSEKIGEVNAAKNYQLNNGTLTIQKNGSNVATFTANQAGNTTANISVPTVNNGILTIQKNGTTVATFSANQAGNTTANITVQAAAPGVFDVGSTVIRAAPNAERFNYGTLTSHGYFHGWCCDEKGGAIGDTTVNYMPGTWVICCGNGNPGLIRGAIMRRIA